MDGVVVELVGVSAGRPADRGRRGDDGVEIESTCTCRCWALAVAIDSVSSGCRCHATQAVHIVQEVVADDAVSFGGMVVDARDERVVRVRIDLILVVVVG